MSTLVKIAPSELVFLLFSLARSSYTGMMARHGGQVLTSPKYDTTARCVLRIFWKAAELEQTCIEPVIDSVAGLDEDA
jgi:hypothetical protein